MEKLFSLLNRKFHAEDILVFLFLFTYPFYFFPSGGIQVSSLIFVLLFAWIFLKNYSELFTSVKKFFFLHSFVFYAVAINIYWGISLSDFSPIKYGLYIAFNYCVFLVFYYLFTQEKRNNYLEVCKIGLRSIALFLVLSTPFFLIGRWEHIVGLRKLTLFFNNPNQLGLFGLHVLCFLMILESKSKNNFNLVQKTFLGCVIFLILLSSSRAALLSLILFVLFFYYKKRWCQYLVLSYVLFCSVIHFFDLYYFLYSITGITETFFERLSFFSTLSVNEYDSLAARGLDRIINHSEYLFLGAGEGSFGRFLTYLKNDEIHANLGTIAFSYGIWGFFTFVLFHISILRKWDKKSWMFIILLQTYGLFHNGLRNPFYWILLALIAAENENSTDEKVDSTRRYFLFQFNSSFLKSFYEFSFLKNLRKSKEENTRQKSQQ